MLDKSNNYYISCKSCRSLRLYIKLKSQELFHLKEDGIFLLDSHKVLQLELDFWVVCRNPA